MGNPFLLPDATKKKEAPDVMALLGKELWQTELTTELHIISMRLGVLEGKDYKYLYPGAPFEWPNWYLEAVLSHEVSTRVLRVKQEFEANNNKNREKTSANHKMLGELIDPTGKIAAAQMEREKRFQEMRKSQQKAVKPHETTG